MKYLLVITFIAFSFSAIGIYDSSPKKISIESYDNIKKQAFHILQTKCNVCHIEKNKRRIFTLENMNKYSEKIHRQVFKWKRMPKGDDIKLTPQEYQQLKTWIEEIGKV